MNMLRNSLVVVGVLAAAALFAVVAPAQDEPAPTPLPGPAENSAPPLPKPGPAPYSLDIPDLHTPTPPPEENQLFPNGPNGRRGAGSNGGNGEGGPSDPGSGGRGGHNGNGHNNSHHRGRAADVIAEEADADPLEVRVAYRRAKTTAMARDPGLADLLHEADAAGTDPVKREFLRDYYTQLFIKIRHIDPSKEMKAHVALLAEVAEQRYDPKRRNIAGEEDLVNARGRRGRGH